MELLTPNGITLYLEVLDAKCGQKSCSCAIQKDGGDDPDVTSGLRIYANVTLCERQEAEVICQKYQRSAKADLQDTSKGVAAAAVDGKKDRQQAWIEECDFCRGRSRHRDTSGTGTARRCTCNQQGATGNDYKRGTGSL